MKFKVANFSIKRLVACSLADSLTKISGAILNIKESEPIS